MGFEEQPIARIEVEVSVDLMQQLTVKSIVCSVSAQIAEEDELNHPRLRKVPISQAPRVLSSAGTCSEGFNDCRL